MTSSGLTSLQRVLTAVSHKEPDRVPLSLLFSLHGAKELGISIKDYYSKPENVLEGQLRLRAHYHSDCLYAFFYAPVEIEARGGEVIYADDGPPNSGEPLLRKPEDILSLEAIRVRETPCLVKVLKAIEMLKERARDEVPIIGVVMSPFSVPVMQLGFDRYLNIIYERPDLFQRLMAVNETFCIEWANAQLEAGATAIWYFDPVSSPTIVPRELFLKTGFEIAKRTIARIKGPVATHLASGRCLPIVDDLAQTGALIIGVSAEEDLAGLKAACRGRLTLLGNLNGIEMRRWTPEEAKANVKEAIAKAGPGGGFILADNHGEIPFQVPDKVLQAITEAVEEWGRYPLEWISGGR
ncbi:MAG: uroporphyrinogen decarboxylase family protein [Chloroflexi bacterium]|nr:uroporphyrinogen decarboxylase family protein [Chloroflexota bacterium]